MATDAVVGYRKRFKYDLLQRTYSLFAVAFGFTKEQVRDAMERLEELGVIWRELRHITTPKGQKLGMSCTLP